MYFSSDISIDPAQLTEIKRVKPTKAFGKLFFFLTAGLSGKKQEFETFTAVSILQQLNVVLRSVGVDNILRLAIDGEDLYHDTQGRKDDLKDAMAQVEVRAKSHPADSEITAFERIEMVLEHDLQDFRLLISVEIDRVHDPDQHPIKIEVQALMSRYKATADENPAQLRTRMRADFADQRVHDTLLDTQEAAYGAFIKRLEDAIYAQLHVHAVKSETRRNLIRPSTRLADRNGIRRGDDHCGDDLFYGYYGFDDYFMYAWMWSELSHDHSLHVHDVSVVDDLGHGVFDVGARGFDAGASSALDPTAAFIPPTDADDLTFHGDNAYSSELEAAGVDAVTGASASDDDSGWLGGVFDGDYGGGDTSTSTCGSSCGSSCGGCGGD